MADKRYSIRLEWCGHATRRWVVRFCGDWIESAETRADANIIARNHAMQRQAELTA